MVRGIFEEYLKIRSRALEQTAEVNERLRLDSADPKDVIKMYMSTVFPGLADRPTPKVFVLYSKQMRRYLIDTARGEPKEGTVERSKLTSDFVAGITGEEYGQGDVLLLEFK